MMVSTRGRYALRLMIDIAKQGEAGALVTMRDKLRSDRGFPSSILSSWAARLCAPMC